MDALSSINHRIAEIQFKINPVPMQVNSTSAAATAVSTTQFTGTSAYAPATGNQWSFADLLANATKPAGGTTLSSAASQLNAEGVPHDLARYGNGRVPTQALAQIPGSNEQLWAPAAEQLGKLIADARAAGNTIGVTDGYRTYDRQVGLVQSKGLYREGGLAAVPGTSQHGWGLAADLKLDATAQAWMREHAGEYGFVEAVAREPWHWEFQPDKVTPSA